MSRRWGDDERGVSELLGTVLIFAFVIFIAVSMIFVGYQVFENASAQTEDRLAQDSMQTMSDRLDTLSKSQVKSASEFDFPTYAADDMDVNETGTVTINVTTRSDLQTEVEAYDATNSSYESGTYNFTLGTIAHEAEDGTTTVYQGGALFEQQANLTRVLSEPKFDYRGDVIDLSFQTIDVEEFTASGPMTAERLREASENEAGKIRDILEKHWNITAYEDINAPITITVTIESDYVDGWNTYVRNRLTESPSDIDLRRDKNELELTFEDFGGGLGIDTDPDFGDGVYYSGEAGLTSLVNATNATVTGAGGNVTVGNVRGHGTPTPHYIMGVYDNSSDEWVVWDSHGSGQWKNLVGTTVPESAVPVDDPIVTGSNNDTYQANPGDTWVCAVETDPSNSNPDHEQFVDYVDTPDEGCLANPMMTDIPDGSVVGPHFNVTLDNVALKNGNINTDDVVTGDQLEIDWTVTNTDVSNGTTPVVLLYNDSSMSSPAPLDYTEVSVDGHAVINTTGSPFVVNATGSGNVTFQVATVDSNHKSAPINITDSSERGKFEIENLVIADKTLTAGQDLEADVTLNNTASDGDTQVVELQYNGTAVAWREVSIGANTQRTETLNWTTTNAFAPSTSNVTVRTYDDTANATNVDLSTGASTNTSFEVDIQSVTNPVYEGDTVDVTATVENVGNTTTEQDIALLADGHVAAVLPDVNLSSGATSTRTLHWGSDGHGGDNVTLTVASADDTDNTTVAVQTLAPPDFDVSIDEVRVDGAVNGAVEPGTSKVTVDATVENTGDSEAPTVWLEGFSDRVVTVNDTVQTIGKRAGDPNTTSVTLEWDVPADADTSTPAITVGVDGDSENHLLDIESRLVVDDMSFDKQKQASFTSLDIEDSSWSGGFFSTGESEYTVDYEVTSNRSFDAVEIEFDGEGSVHEQFTRTSATGSVSYSESGEYGANYDITARIIKNGTTIDTVTISDQADDNDPTVDVSGANPADSVIVDADIENIGDTQTTDSVTLTGPSGNQIDNTSITLASGGSTSVSFKWDSPARTGNLTVSTPDDEASERVIIKRDGPDCSAVSYSTDSQGRYEISNVDQLQCINEHDLDGEYVLVDDIDAYGTSYWNNGKGFEPIGPEGHDSINIPGDSPWETFSGEFNGNGHTIEGLYIDRPTENYVGLFGATDRPYDDVPVGYGSTVENIILKDVHVVGNMYVGGLAGQAGGKIINARAEGYVEGDKQLVGGLIGVGAHADIDNRIVADMEVVGGNVPNHLSGVREGNAKGVGGLIGRAAWETEIARGYSTGDVTAPINVGGIMGSSSLVDSEFEEMYSASNVTATDPGADAGSIVGIVQSDGDRFDDDMYYDKTLESSAWGEAERLTGYSIVDMGIGEVEQTDWNDRNTSQMQGLNVNQPGRLGNLDFEEDGGPWVAIPGEYPRFQWELDAEGRLDVDIHESQLDSITAGQSLDVPITLTNTNYENVTQTVRLFSDGTPVDSTTVSVSEQTLGGNPTTRTLPDALTWSTDADDAGQVELEVVTEDESDRVNHTIKSPVTNDSYTVDNINTDGPITAGDTLTVDADISYNGSSPNPEPVTLQNSNGAVVNSTTINGTGTVTLTWPTDGTLVTSGSINETISVGTSDDRGNETVTITAPKSGEFHASIVAASDPVVEGENVTVEAEIENVGNGSATQDVLLQDFDGNPVDVTPVSLSNGSTTSVMLTWNTVIGDAGKDDVTVATRDDTATETVEITAQSKDFTVSIENVSYNGSTISDGETIQAGEGLSAEINVTNTGNHTTEQPVWLAFEGRTVAFASNIRLNSGQSTTRTLSWSVHEATDGDDIVAKTNGDTDTFDLTIEPVETMRAPITSPDGEPINIDLDKIAIS